MKVSAIETIRIGEFPNLLWVQVHTDQGLEGPALNPDRLRASDVRTRKTP